MLFLNLRPKRK